MTNLIELYLKRERGEIKTFPHDVFEGEQEVMRLEYTKLIKFVSVYEGKCIWDMNYLYLKSLGLCCGLDRFFNSSVTLLKYYFFNKQRPIFTYGRVSRMYWNPELIKEAIDYYLTEEVGVIDYNEVSVSFLKTHHLYCSVRRHIGTMQELYRYLSKDSYALYIKRVDNKNDAILKTKSVMDKNNLLLENLTVSWMFSNGLRYVYCNIFNSSIDKVKEAILLNDN